MDIRIAERKDLTLTQKMQLDRSKNMNLIEKEMEKSSGKELEGLAEYWIYEGNKFTDEPFLSKGEAKQLGWKLRGLI
jgi:hypothetical protein